MQICTRKYDKKIQNSSHESDRESCLNYTFEIVHQLWLCSKSIEWNQKVNDCLHLNEYVSMLFFIFLIAQIYLWSIV